MRGRCGSGEADCFMFAKRFVKINESADYQKSLV